LNCLTSVGVILPGSIGAPATPFSCFTRAVRLDDVVVGEPDERPVYRRPVAATVPQPWRQWIEQLTTKN
jgi:hypothetical protein